MWLRRRLTVVIRSIAPSSSYTYLYSVYTPYRFTGLITNDEQCLTVLFTIHTDRQKEKHDNNTAKSKTKYTIKLYENFRQRTWMLYIFSHCSDLRLPALHFGERKFHPCSLAPYFPVIFTGSQPSLLCRCPVSLDRGICVSVCPSVTLYCPIKTTHKVFVISFMED